MHGEVFDLLTKDGAVIDQLIVEQGRAAEQTLAVDGTEIDLVIEEREWHQDSTGRG